MFSKPTVTRRNAGPGVVKPIVSGVTKPIDRAQPPDVANPIVSLADLETSKGLVIAALARRQQGAYNSRGTRLLFG
jgi:hypothetical protein